MKNSKIFNIYVFSLFVLLVAGCAEEKKESSKEGEPKNELSEKENGNNVNHSGTGGMRIAYIHNDTLSVKYKRIEKLNKELEEKQKAAESRLAGLEAELMKYYDKLQKEFHLMAKSDQEAAEKEFERRQRNLEQEKMRLEQELGQLQVTVLSGHLKTIEAVCKEYAQQNGYDYVFIYQPGGPMLYGNDAHDVTMKIVEILNKEHSELTGE